MKQFKGIHNLNSVFQLNKLITLALLITLIIVVIVSNRAISRAYRESSNTVYVFTDRGLKRADKIKIEENREVEIDDHIRKFYRRFWTLTPNAQAIKNTIDKSFFLGGDCLNRLYNLYAESGFYSKLVQDNIRVTSTLDSVRVNSNTYPYEVLTYGRLKLTRSTNEQIRYFNTKMVIYDLEQRSLENVNALTIEDITVLNNKAVE